MWSLYGRVPRNSRSSNETYCERAVCWGQMTRVRNPESENNLKNVILGLEISWTTQRYRVVKYSLSNYTLNKFIDIGTELYRCPGLFPSWETLVLMYFDATQQPRHAPGGSSWSDCAEMQVFSTMKSRRYTISIIKKTGFHFYIGDHLQRSKEWKSKPELLLSRPSNGISISNKQRTQYHDQNPNKK